jgi:hypothetical protein
MLSISQKAQLIVLRGIQRNTYDRKLRKPISAAVKKYYDSGGLKDAMAFKNSRPNGLQKRYRIKMERQSLGNMYEENGRKVKMLLDDLYHPKL